MASIFLCHSSEDKFFVRELAGKLSAAGVHVWLDEEDLTIVDLDLAKSYNPDARRRRLRANASGSNTYRRPNFGHIPKQTTEKS